MRLYKRRFKKCGLSSSRLLDNNSRLSASLLLEKSGKSKVEELLSLPKPDRKIYDRNDLNLLPGT